MEMTLETKKDIVEDMLMAAGTKKTMEWLESAGYYTAPALKRPSCLKYFKFFVRKFRH